MNGTDDNDRDDGRANDASDDLGLDMLEQEGRDTLAGERLRDEAVDDLFGGRADD